MMWSEVELGVNLYWKWRKVRVVLKKSISYRSNQQKSTNYYHTVLLVIFLIISHLCDLATSKVYSVHWNTTNPIFRIDNTDHIIDVNRDSLPYDQVNIICPVYAPGTKEEDAEKYIIYNVSKEEYDTCRITNPNPRIIAVCDKPYKLMYFTITFRSFTPQPGGLEFRPGQDYYFISTSSRDDLHRRVGGRCSSENMKVVFKVCCHPGENSVQISTGAPAVMSSSSQSPNLNLSPQSGVIGNGIAIIPTRRPLIIYTPSPRPPPSPPTPPLSVHHPPTPTRYTPVRKYSQQHSPTSKPLLTKKKDSEKHPNEVFKKDELTSSSTKNISGTLLQLLTLLISSFLITQR